MKLNKIILSFILILLLVLTCNTCFAATVNYVTGYDDFDLYATSDFYQYRYGNNCGPTAVANIMEYYSKVRGLNMYSGRITQTMYDQICDDVGYSPNGQVNMLSEINRSKKIRV